MTRPKKELQLNSPVYQANLSWFLMFSEEIQNNLVAKLTPNVFSVWVTLRACAELATGIVRLSTTDLQTKTGLSRKTVLKAIQRLSDENYIQICSEGKQKRRFFVVDVIKYHEVADKSAETRSLSLRYVPKTSARDREEVAGFLQTGAGPTNPNVWAHGKGGVTVNTGGPVYVFQLGDSNVIAATAASIETPEVRELFLRASQAARRSSGRTED